MEQTDCREKLNDLLTELCLSGSSILDQSKLKLLKDMCKADDRNLRYSHEALIEFLNREHCEIRYSALQIIDILFLRSHLFRELILDDFSSVCELIIETNPDYPLPPPIKKAIELKKLAAKTIKCWHEKFANDYQLLDLGFNYLKNVKKIDFVSYSHQSEAQRVHQQKQDEKKRILLNKRFADHLKEMNDCEYDLKECINQLEASIRILMPGDELFSNEDFNIGKKSTSLITNQDEKVKQTNDNDQAASMSQKNDDSSDDDDDDDDDDDFVEVRVKKSKEELDEEREIEMKYMGFDCGNGLNKMESGTKLKLELFDNEENNALIETMRGLYKELKNSYLCKLIIWIKTFSVVKNGTNDELRKAIELKNSIKSVLKKCTDLKLPLEETQKLKSKATNSTIKCDMPCTSREISDDQFKAEEDDETTQKRNKLLKLAPIVNLDELDFYSTPKIQKVETNHHLYQFRDESNYNGAENDELTKMAPRLAKLPFVGKFEPVKWSCRAPLKNGKLCPRMDRFKCPFHGKIVARDEMGNVVNESDRKLVEAELEKRRVKDEADLIADINAATGQNLKPLTSKDEKARTSKKRGRGTAKTSNLTDLKKEADTTRSRLEKKLLDPKNLNKVGQIMDTIERKQHHEKFHHNYSYSISLF